MSELKVMRLEDYRPPEFTAAHVEMNIDIHPEYSMVRSRVEYNRTEEGQGVAQLVLNAENPNGDDAQTGEKRPFIRSVKLNGRLLESSQYVVDGENHQLIIPVSADFPTAVVEIENILLPKINTDLSGLYDSDGILVTQCEPQSFRRIMPFLDRPDVMPSFAVRLEAPLDVYPVLLANGNKIGEGENADNGRHWVRFEDPFPKPCYLFAAAGGNFEALSEIYTTQTGRNITLNIFTEPGRSQFAGRAMESLKKMLAFDEQVFGAEYRLDVYNILSVSKFTFGAMENRGLNVFKSKYVEADRATATDMDFMLVDRLVGHEGLHHKSGNDVTLRDFFHISLKEGLTVIREQMFTASLTSEELDRIKNVQLLRAVQFGEDNSPLAHAVLPQEAASIENCYSQTIYQKGAEIIRMMQLMIGKEQFIEGVKHFFSKHDGEAVTINDFVTCMEDVSGFNFSGQFFLWYSQSGRASVQAEGIYDQESQTYCLTLSQYSPPTADGQEKQPLVIPVRMGLVANNGVLLPLSLAAYDIAAGNGEMLLLLSQERQQFVFSNLSESPAFHSLFRGFSAPVDVDAGLTPEQLRLQMVLDSDGFNRWEAGQKYALHEMQRLYHGFIDSGSMPEVSVDYIDAIRTLLQAGLESLISVDGNIDPALLAKSLELPDIKGFEKLMQPASPVAVAAVVNHIKHSIGRELSDEFTTIFSQTGFESLPYRDDYLAVGKRSLKALALNYLASAQDGFSANLAASLYENTDNMTDKMAALNALNLLDCPSRDQTMQAFFNQFADDPVIIQKWLALQAGRKTDDSIEHLRELVEQPYFDWTLPDHPRMLLGHFIKAYDQFHRADGKGYEFVADMVMRWAPINSRSAGLVLEPLCQYAAYTPEHQEMMVAQLKRIAAMDDLSVDLKEKVVKSIPTQRQAFQQLPGAVPTL